MIVEAVLTHPWDFAFGLLLLIAGPWALRKAGALTLIALSIGVAGAAFTSLTQSGLVASSLLSAVMVYAACVLLAVAAMRHSIVARNGEVLFILALCFLCGRMISSTLNWPEAVVWLLLLLGTIVSPTIPVAVFAAVFLTLTFGVPSATISFAIFAFCLAVAVLQHGGWRRGHIDKSLLAQAHSTPIGALGRNRNSGDQNIEVVIRAESGSQAKQLMRSLERDGVECEEFLAGDIGARVSASMIRQWSRPWTGLFRHTPCEVRDGGIYVPHPPYDVMARNLGVELSEVVDRIRSHDGSTLDSDVATGRGVRVAVLDTGVNPVSPRLRKAVMDRISFIPNESEEDLRGHGTSVAECVAAVASEVEIASLKVLDANGRGSLFSILKGLKYVADHRDEIDCANLSLGAKLCGGRNADPLCRSLTELAKLGVPTVTAIGNSGECGRGSVECPGASPGTLGVAAVDLNGRAMSWSSKGPCLDDSIHKPDVACFGSNLVLPDHRGNLHAVSGTSFAVPLVAGTLAACLEMTKKRPGVEQLYDLVRKSCVPAESHSNKPDLVGNGIANLRRAAEIVGATHSEQRTARIRATSLQAGRRCLARFAVTAACLAAVASTWWFGLDHIGFMGATSAPGEVWLLGRVRASASGAMLFDDGTGAVAVQWNGQSDARPRAESIVLLKGQIASAHDKQVAMSGTYRFVLLPSLH